MKKFMILVALGTVMLSGCNSKNNSDEQKIKEEQAERKKEEVEKKEKEEQEKKAKEEAEKKLQEEQEKAEAEQRAKEEEEQKAKEEAENIAKEEEQLKMSKISEAKNQLLGKKYFISPSLFDGIDANKAMTENKAPQNLMHDGGKGVTFTNENTVHIELAGTYRPDIDMDYTLTEDTLTIGQDNIPYSINDGVITFGTWTTDWGGHEVSWSIKENS
jgi:hypothetical protein